MTAKLEAKIPARPNHNDNVPIGGYTCFLHSGVTEDSLNPHQNAALAWIYLSGMKGEFLGTVIFYTDAQNPLPLPSYDAKNKTYTFTYYIKELSAVLHLLGTGRAILGYTAPDNATLSAAIG
jgi:hypothetical protein